MQLRKIDIAEARRVCAVFIGKTADSRVAQEILKKLEQAQDPSAFPDDLKARILSWCHSGGARSKDGMDARRVCTALFGYAPERGGTFKTVYPFECDSCGDAVDHGAICACA